MMYVYTVVACHANLSTSYHLAFVKLSAIAEAQSLCLAMRHCPVQ